MSKRNDDWLQLVTERAVGSRWEAVATAVMVLAAVVTTSLVVRRELREPGTSGPIPAAASEQPDWSEALSAARPLGHRGVPEVSIIMFADLECPYCARMEPTLRGVADRFRGQVGLYFLHYPLASHRFAVPAARAAECADREGRFAPFVWNVFRKQDSLGLKSWGSFAAESGIRDTVAIASCATEARQYERIERGKALGDRWRVTGTPTILVNEQRFRGAVPDSVLTAAVERALARRR